MSLLRSIKGRILDALFYPHQYSVFYKMLREMQRCWEKHMYFSERKGVIASLKRKYYLRKANEMHSRLCCGYATEIHVNVDTSNVTFRHPLGIVIGRGAVFGKGVIIHHGVSVGASHFRDDDSRRGVDCRQIIGDGVILCASAKVLGDVTIGKNSVIGANAIVTRDIPEGVLVVGFNHIVGSSSRAFKAVEDQGEV